MASLSQWIEGARPRTLPNAVAPVLAGTGAAAWVGGEAWWKAALALVVSISLIIGVNYANDYSDGIRGTDDDRSGPLRITASGLAQPKDVKLAAFVAFGVAGLFGIVLSVLAGAWWLILVGAACIAAAWFYTGGNNPYGYIGLGEVSVFIFFGLVAVMGTEFVQTGFLSWEGLLVAVAIGAISASVNLVNNIRDIPTDSASGKQTIAVRLGDSRARTLFTVLTCVPFVVSVLLALVYAPALVGLVALPLAIAAILKVRSGATGTALIPVLGLNGKAMLAWAVLTAVALAFGGMVVPYA